MSAGALAAIFGTAFLVSLSGALSPGPLTTLAVREGARRGFWAGPLLATGHGAIELLLVIALALGLDRALKEDAVAATIALAGGVFLLWLALHILRSPPLHELASGGAGDGSATNSWRLPSRPEGGGPVQAAALLMATGVAVSVSNPFWLAWWATIGAAYIAEALDQGAAGVATFYSAHLLTDLGWLSLIAFLLARGRRLMSGRAYRAVMLVCGAFLLALAGWFLTSGLGYIF